MSYSNVSNVLAFTRHLLDGQSTFNSTTRPTATEVQSFIARASAHLDVALAAAGFSIPVTTATVRILLDDWVTNKAAQYVELTQRGAGYNETEGARTATFGALAGDANKFVADHRLGFVRLGASVAYAKADGLQFTAIDVQEDRADPDDDTLEQPKFTRGLFDAT